MHIFAPNKGYCLFICTRFGRYLYSTKQWWIIKSVIEANIALESMSAGSRAGNVKAVADLFFFSISRKPELV